MATPPPPLPISRVLAKKGDPLRVSEPNKPDPGGHTPAQSVWDRLLEFFLPHENLSPEFLEKKVSKIFQFVLERLRAWVDTKSLLRLNRAWPEDVTMTTLDFSLGCIIDEKRRKLRRQHAVLQMTPSEEIDQTLLDNTKTLWVDPMSTGAAAVIATHSNNLSIQAICELKNHLTQQRWEEHRQQLYPKINPLYDWVLDEDYLRLYEALREKRYNTMLMRLVHTSGTSFVKVIRDIESDTTKRSPVMGLLNPCGSTQYNAIVLTLAAFLIRHIISPQY